LEGDQKISIIISPDAIEGKAIVDVSYREINSLRAARLFLTQLVQFESGVLSPKTWRDHPILIPIVGFFVIAICFGVAVKFWQKGNNLDTGQKQVATIQQNGQAPAEPAVATASNQ